MTKVSLFNEELQETAAVFKALAHPARLAILQYLAETRVCISGDISNELPLSRTTVNQHLQELKNLDLIKGEISGTKTNYCLNRTGIVKMKASLESFLSGIDTTIPQNC
jgi:ArsR family transcriptional regulator, arsenate/arsenite/antimonite-responsive transcriptional repressor